LIFRKVLGTLSCAFGGSLSILKLLECRPKLTYLTPAFAEELRAVTEELLCEEVLVPPLIWRFELEEGILSLLVLLHAVLPEVLEAD
jgi:hypothetical protein